MGLECACEFQTVKWMNKSVQQSGMDEWSKIATLLPQKTGGFLERLWKDTNDLHEERNTENECNCNTKYRSGMVSRVKAGKDYELEITHLIFAQETNS